MLDNNFDYISFSINMKSWAFSRMPNDINSENSTFICSIIEDFIKIAGEGASKENFLTAKQQKFCCQIIAKYTFHKSVNIIQANIPQEYWNAILQSIAFTIYEVIKQAYQHNIEQEKILQTVEYHVNKNFHYKLDELYAKNLIDKTIYTKALSQSNIELMSEEKDHNNCYMLENNQEKFLHDSVSIAYARNLAYRYLFKAAHCLKKVSMQTNDRKEILFFLRNAIETIIGHIQIEIFNFSIPQVERIITVSMELLFHRIIGLYKNNILSNDDWSKECVSYFASIIYTIEFRYVKDNDKLKDVYAYDNLFSNKQLREYLNEFVKDNTFTQEQVNKAFGKSYITYLEKEICALMKTRNIPNLIIKWLLYFTSWFSIWFILQWILHIVFK
ncbi:MAG: hypothetical protein NC408_08900 [Candidatus Gastranaerophilales bacterium]|nr:hypothetical protein [Candidatus Gastranaerophilales bacterium]MCM1073128.1 hypothetical protein [Bacteroides sp.]